MKEDRFFTALGSLVDRVLNDRTRPDFRALYYAKVISWQAGGGPSGNVDVAFEDTYADGTSGAFKLGTANGVVILPPIGGLSYKPQPGTRVLVGWQGGDERFPYVAGWVSNGGSLETMIASTTKTDITSTLVNLGASPATAFVVIQPIVTALTTVLTAVGVFATAVGAGTANAGIIAAAVTLNTAITAFGAASATYTATKVKAT